MSRPVKYLVLAIGFLVLASSGVFAVAPNFGGMMVHGCVQMMQGMHGGMQQRPNEQWRQQP